MIYILYISTQNADRSATVSDLIHMMKMGSALHLQHNIVERCSVGQRGVPVDAVDGEVCSHIGKGLGKERVTPPWSYHSDPKQG